MEFPHLGKHCSENSCNKLGKLWWWHARIYMYKSICAICVRLYMMCMWNVPFWAKRMTTVTVQTNTAYPNRKKRKKTQCVLPQCMRIPNIYSLYVVTKSCCSHLYKKKNTEILFSIRFMPKSSCDIEREIKLEKPIWITESVEATNSLSMLAFIWHMPMHAMHAVRAQYTKCCTRTTLGKVQWYKWMCSFILTWIVYNWHIESIYSVSVFLQRQ